MIAIHNDEHRMVLAATKKLSVVVLSHSPHTYQLVKWKMHYNIMKHTTPAILPANNARSEAMQDVSALTACVY